MIKEPGLEPRRVDIHRDLLSIKTIVNGKIHNVSLVDNIVCIYGGSDARRRPCVLHPLTGEPIRGTVVFAKASDGGFPYASLQDADAQLIESYIRAYAPERKDK